MNFKHDPIFMGILREKKNIRNFLDSVFGFLYRCTDFYVESPTYQRVGLTNGIAAQLVNDAFQNWKNAANEFEQEKKTEALSINHEAKITNTESSENKKKYLLNKKSIEIESKNIIPDPSECFNGASRENYSWSQSIYDLDVVIRVPQEVQKTKQLQVTLYSDAIEVVYCAKIPQTLIKGQLSFKIKNTDSFWCLDPGKHVTLHLEKTDERWWESLLEDEPRIELSKIDCSRKLEEMDDDEQMKVAELMWNERRKLLGQPTPELIES